MPSNNSKYTAELRKQIAVRILETGQSATSMAEKKGLRISLLKDSIELKQKKV